MDLDHTRKTTAYKKLAGSLVDELMTEAIPGNGDRLVFIAYVLTASIGIPLVIVLATVAAMHYDSWLIAVCSTLLYLGWGWGLIAGSCVMSVVGHRYVTRLADKIVLDALKQDLDK